MNVSSLTMLRPAAVLIAGALLVFAISKIRSLPEVSSRVVAMFSVAVAAVMFLRLGNNSAQFINLSLGWIDLPFLSLTSTPLAAAWLRLLFLGGLACLCFIPTRKLPSSMIMLCCTSLLFLADSFAAICLAWMLIEAVIYIGTKHEENDERELLALCLGPAALVSSMYFSASYDTLALRASSLLPVSWMLLLLAVSLRLRLWPWRWPQTEPANIALWQLVAIASSAYLLIRLFNTSMAIQMPSWLNSLLLISAAVAAVFSWANRTNPEHSQQQQISAILATMMLLATLALPLTVLFATAAAQLTGVLLLSQLSPALPLPEYMPPQLKKALPILAGVSLLPFPFLPFGRAITQVLAVLATLHPLAAIIAAGTLTGALSLFLLSVLTKATNNSISMKPATSTMISSLLLAVFVIAFGFLTKFDAGTTPIIMPLNFLAKMLVFFGLAIPILATVGVYRRAKLPAWLSRPVVNTRTLGLPNIVPNLLRQGLSGMELIFSFIEGETALPWATIVGFIILALVAGY